MREGVERFAIQTLGCRCPREVFEDIRVDHNDAPTEDRPYRWRLIIGGRLLIYILPLEQASPIEPWLASLARAGRDERDGRGLNRFRAVVTLAGPNEQSAPLQARFAALTEADPKAHLHLLTPGDLPAFLAAPNGEVAEGSEAPP